MSSASSAKGSAIRISPPGCLSPSAPCKPPHPRLRQTRPLLTRAAHPRSSPPHLICKLAPMRAAIRRNGWRGTHALLLPPCNQRCGAPQCERSTFPLSLGVANGSWTGIPHRCRSGSSRPGTAAGTGRSRGIGSRSSGRSGGRREAPAVGFSRVNGGRKLTPLRRLKIDPLGVHSSVVDPGTRPRSRSLMR
jgi:hypothetical protein